MSVLLSMEGIEKSFPGVKALKGISLQVEEGEVHALMGENGAGKSTLIKVLTGVYGKDKGKIFFAGEEIHCKSPAEAGELGISTIYQELNLIPYQTVYENMFLGRERKKNVFFLDRKSMQEEAKKALEELGLHIDVKKSLNQYSTAIQQMVAIARAVRSKARLVIMDEPTSSLDQNEVQVLFRIIHQLKEKKISVLFISHKLDEVYEICDSMTIFRDGETVGSFAVKDIDQYKLISLMIGKEWKERVREEKQSFSSAETILSVKEAKLAMRLSGVNLSIKKGEILGLAGLLGSGRTELAELLFGTEKAGEGEVFWMDEAYFQRNPSKSIEKGMGFCTEDRKTEGILPNLSVEENMTIAMLPNLQKNGFIDFAKQRELAKRYVELLRIKTPSLSQKIRNLSGGNQQKVLLARWMCMNPKLMILDEPTRGIDIGAKEEIEKLIQGLSKEGISVLMISSELSELARNCHRVVVLRDGKVRGEMEGEEISEDAIMAMIAEDGKEGGSENAEN